MRALLAVIIGLMGSAAHAADLTITLDPQKWSYIGQVLGKQPYSEVAPLMLELQKQIDQQTTAARAPAPAPAPKEAPQ